MCVRQTGCQSPVQTERSPKSKTAPSADKQSLSSTMHWRGMEKMDSHTAGHDRTQNINLTAKTRNNRARTIKMNMHVAAKNVAPYRCNIQQAQQGKNNRGRNADQAWTSTIKEL